MLVCWCAVMPLALCGVSMTSEVKLRRWAVEGIKAPSIPENKAMQSVAMLAKSKKKATRDETSNASRPLFCLWE